MKIVLASRNVHKIKELEEFLRPVIEPLELLTLDEAGITEEIEETGATFEENAVLKARAAASRGYVGIADDSGLEVDMLEGEPGVFSARYAGEPCDDRRNNTKLKRKLADVPPESRGAAFVSVIACILPWRPDRPLSARGICRGVILNEERGQGGFGYDPLFYYPPLEKTFAEMSVAEKNSISHRARAMKRFVKLLDETLKEYPAPRDL